MERNSVENNDNYLFHFEDNTTDYLVLQEQVRKVVELPIGDHGDVNLHKNQSSRSG